MHTKFHYVVILYRVVVNDKDVKVNIFDMAGHPVFYEVWVANVCRHNVFILMYFPFWFTK